MSVTNIIKRECNDGAAIISVSETVTSGSAVVIDETIPPSSTDLVVACAFVRAKVKSFFLTADAVMTVKTYNSVTLEETISLTAGQAMQWTLADASLLPLPFAADVTSIKVTSSAGGVLRLRVIVDPT